MNGTATSNPGGGSVMLLPRKRKVSGRRVTILPLLPFFLFIAYFLIFPLYEVCKDAFVDNDGNFTLQNFALSFKGVYLQSFGVSMRLSFTSALIGAVAGAGLSSAIVKFGKKSRRVVLATSSVLANTGGVPLAFMFIASFGPEGLVPKTLKLIGINIYAGNFTLFSVSGLVLVYTFFQIPLMVLVFTPALENMRIEWRQASDSLGGSGWHYLRYIAIPVLFPPFFATLLLLFANAFSAYATARAMIAGTIALVPILIGNLVDGNVMSQQQHLGHALALCMIGFSIIVMGLYVVTLRATQRRQ